MKKIALVTGVASGIGLATAKKLLENGVCVIGMSRRATMENPPDGDFTYVSGDIGVEADRERVVNTALQKYGRVDILVNVAGVAPKVRADLLTMTEESYDYVMNINTKGTLFLTQRVANAMIQNEGENKGHIVNISSLSAYTSSTNRGEYCISKAGVSMIKYDNLIDGGLLPISRWGTPEDIANAVFSLCTGLTYMTGQSLDVDGGFHIRRL